MPSEGRTPSAIRRLAGCLAAALCCAAAAAVLTRAAEPAPAYSAKDHTPGPGEYLDFYGAVRLLEDGGVSTFAHTGFTAPLPGRDIELDTRFRLLSGKPASEGGDGADGWITYSFSAAPALCRDDSFPFHGGTRAGVFLHLSNRSCDSAPNRVEAHLCRHGDTERGAPGESVIAPFWLDNALNVRLILSLRQGGDGRWTLGFRRKDDGTLLREVAGIELDESLFLNEHGQTFLSTAIYGSERGGSALSDTREMALYAEKIYTRSAEGAAILLDREEYVQEEGRSVRPRATVRLGDETLRENEDFFFTCCRDGKSGTGEVRAVFIGDFEGCAPLVRTFRIVPAAAPPEVPTEAPTEAPKARTETPADPPAEPGGRGCASAAPAWTALLAAAAAAAARGKKD